MILRTVAAESPKPGLLKGGVRKKNTTCCLVGDRRQPKAKEGNLTEDECFKQRSSFSDDVADYMKEVWCLSQGDPPGGESAGPYALKRSIPYCW